MASKLILFAGLFLATIFLFCSQALAREFHSVETNSDEKTWKELGHKLHFPKEFKHPKFDYKGLPKIHVKKPDGPLPKRLPHIELPNIPIPFKGLPQPKVPKFGGIPKHP